MQFTNNDAFLLSLEFHTHTTVNGTIDYCMLRFFGGRRIVELQPRSSKK